MTSNKFKVRYRNHAKSFRDEKNSNETCRALQINPGSQEKPTQLQFEMVQHAAAYQSSAKQCNLCLQLEKKLCILKANKKNILNKRAELISNSI